MRILNVKWRNFAGWGNSWREIDFEKQKGLTLLCGRNGAGKSSIPNLIVYMLYGQVDGFTQKSIPNRVNRHFEGVITIVAEGRSVVIRRGLMPSAFAVTVDGEPIDTAGKANVQAYLETEIYKTPYNIFKNTIALSMDTFKSFVKLSPSEKCELIDRIFGYSIINTASAKARECVKEIKCRISEGESSIEGYNTTVSEMERRISTMVSRQNEAKDEPDETNVSDIEGLITESVRDYNSIEETIRTLEGMRSDNAMSISGFRSELKQVGDKIKLFESGKCPLCGSDLNTQEHIEYANTLKDASKNLTDNIMKFGKREKKIGDKLDIAVSKRKNIGDRINSLKIEKTKLESRRKERDLGYEEQISNLRAMCDEIHAKIAPKQSEIDKDCKRLEVMNTVCGVFSNDGLKQYISDIYVPMINGYVEGACTQLGINYRIVFDTGYACSIWSLGEEVPYSTLSTGERKKVDIAVTLAFLQIVKSRVPDINILFLDEVLTNIDVESCNDMLRIFKKFADDNGLSIYIVHHANLDSVYADNVVEIEKRNGFSNFVGE